MENIFDIRDGILYKYLGNQENVVIPESVYIIHEKAFRFCNTVVSIEIPKTVVRIEWGAFSFCENLEQITIPESVEFISVSAIEGCTKLKSISMTDNKFYYVKNNMIFRVNDESIIISSEII